MSPDITYSKLRYEAIDGVAYIRLDDPATLNAFSATMALELIDALQRAQQECRAILIGSVGKAFSSGANLGEGNFRLDDPQRDVGINLEKAFNPLIECMQDCRVPVISAVRGPAVGVAVGVACAADLIVMAQSAFFHLPFCRIGLVPDAGATYTLARSVGRIRALELMLLGERLGAQQAQQWGLVNKVVADAEVDEASMQLALRLAAGPQCVGAIRQLAWQADTAALKAHLRAERTSQRDAGRSADFAAAVEAFRAKRKA